MRGLRHAAAIVLICLAGQGAAAADQDISVTSARLQISEKTGDILFEGDVVVRTSDLVLECDTLTVKADSRETSRILSGQASGNVVLTRGGDKVEGRTATFDLEEGTVELTGAPRLTRQDTVIEAAAIRYFIEEGKASFSGPVRAFFRTREDGS